MRTLTAPAAALLLGAGLVLGTAGNVAADKLITGRDIKNLSITGQDIKPGSVPGDRLKAGASEVLMETVTLTAEQVTVTGPTAEWKAGPTLASLTADQMENVAGSSWTWRGDLGASGGFCQVQLRLNGQLGGSISGVTDGVIAPRDSASGLPTGKRQHKPLLVQLFYRGTATSCTIGSPLNPSHTLGTMQENNSAYQQ